MKRKIVFLMVLSAGLAGVLFFSVKIYRKCQNDIQRQVLLEKKRRQWQGLEKVLKNKIINFRGTAAIVIEDLDTKLRISFNENKLLPSASLVKVPIMLSCFYAAQEGKLNLKNSVVFKSPDKITGSVEELFNLMITQSDNAATNVLIDYVGFEALTAYFKKIGLKDTNISRKMLDFAQRRAGEENYTTAQDMAFLLKQLYHKKFLSKAISEKCLKILGQQKINDRIPKKLPKGTYVAHKTGLENYICHDAGIVFTKKGNFLICVLVKHQDRYARYAKNFISDITLTTYNYYRNL